MRNHGQQNALLAGIRSARCEVVITMDDDLQHPPEEIPRLLKKLGDGHDVVYGTPQQQRHGVWRRIAAYVTKFVLQGAMGVEIARQVDPSAPSARPCGTGSQATALLSSPSTSSSRG